MARKLVDRRHILPVYVETEIGNFLYIIADGLWFVINFGTVTVRIGLVFELGLAG